MAKMRKIWAFSSGKGGTGKSVISSNVGVHLASMGLKVLLIDADLGAANLHTCLGLAPPEVSLSDFISQKAKTIEETIVPTDFPNLSLISGARDSFGVANIKYQQKQRLIREFKRQEYDLIILDIGSGTSFAMVEFFQAGEQGVFVMVPEPTSVENLYRLLNTLFFRRLRKFKAATETKPIVKKATAAGGGSEFRNPQEFLAEVDKISPEQGKKMRDFMSKFHLSVVINQVRNDDDRDLGASIRSVSRVHFGIKLDLLGMVDYDEAVWQSVRKRSPLVQEYPRSRAASAIAKVAENLLHISRKAGRK